jgi:hypothetical protein
LPAYVGLASASGAAPEWRGVAQARLYQVTGCSHNLSYVTGLPRGPPPPGRKERVSVPIRRSRLLADPETGLPLICDLVRWKDTVAQLNRLVPPAADAMLRRGRR